MPVTPTYPGVYIEEVPSGVRTIVGVATSITAFIGNFSRGPMKEAKRIFNRQEFDREFGGLRKDSLASYAIAQFFLNGGTQAWIVRTAGVPSDAAKTAAKAAIKVNSNGGAAFVVEAANEGKWGDHVRLTVDHGTGTPGTTFNMTVSELDPDGNVITSEVFPNLSMTEGDPRDALAVVEDQSGLIRLKDRGSGLPLQSGTVSKKLTKNLFVSGDPENASAIVDADKLSVEYDGDTIEEAVGTTPETFPALASALQTVVNKHPKLGSAVVAVKGSAATGAFLQVTAGTSDPAAVVTLGAGAATKLDFGDGNVQAYALGAGTVANTGQVAAGASDAAQPGQDGDPPSADALKEALPKLDKVDLFNILCIPDTNDLVDTEAQAVAATANAYVEKRRAFYILDPPNKDRTRDEPDEITAWLDSTTLRHKNAALYYPRPKIADPLNEYRLKTVPASGTIAGLYARTDAGRGVWVSPAGTDAPLRGVQDLEYLLTDDENGIVNPLGINALRQFRVFGRVCWGSRTLDGADQLTSEWKYVPVRRLALFLEESLYRGTQFAVHEPNDEPLWAQLRLAVGTFMQDLFRQGAFQGQTPREAYLVKCDAETTTQSDIDKGIVNVLVGFAPLKPAEFVIIRIQQLAGGSQA